ncbi:hypothetical protein [Hyphomonas sp.]|uniref:hypothetical protein n=1 Tax=Hyphomonas sp. TaxID=87 RepID=UPI003528AF25
MNARHIALFAMLVTLGVAAFLAFGRHTLDATVPPGEIETDSIGILETVRSDVRDGLTPIVSGNIGPAPEPGFYTEEEYAQFKESYYCDLARDTRLKCESLDRGPDGLEQCLKLSQYYTYSRHCGTQP